MFRNYLAAALRNLVRNKLYAAINVVGLAVGFAAAIFAGLFLRDELTYDRWMPGYAQVYDLATTMVQFKGTQPGEAGQTFAGVAGWLKLDYPQVAAVARLGYGDLLLRRGDVVGAEQGRWADPDTFLVLSVRSIAGDPTTALEQPDGLVLTRTMARKYFGRDAPLGEVIDVNGDHPMHVAAVIEDWPSNSSFGGMQIFLSGRAPFSWQSRANAQSVEVGAAEHFDGWMYAQAPTFFRLKPGASIDDLRRDMSAFVARHLPASIGEVKLRLRPLASIHLDAASDYIRSHPGAVATLYAVGLIGLLTVAVATINFVNLMTARAARRAVEVGVRKVSGAVRRDLIAQFIGESLIYGALGMGSAVILARILLPTVDALLGRVIVFDIWSDPLLIVAVIAVVVVMGMLGGFYPAIVLSSFRPAAVLKSATVQASGSEAVRWALVVVQFAILISLMLATTVVYRQTEFAMNDNLRFDKDQVLVLERGCTSALKTEILALSGVRGAACSWNNSWVVGRGYDSTLSRARAGMPDVVGGITPVDFGYFEVYGIKPLAGRLFSPNRTTDSVGGASANPGVIINEAARRKLGFRSPDEAIGREIMWRRMPVSRQAQSSLAQLPSQIIGVVPDFSTRVQTFVEPTLYYADMSMSVPADTVFGPIGAQTLNIKLVGRDIPETLAAIDRLWRRLGEPGRPVQRRFVGEWLQTIYLDFIRQGDLLAAFAGVAVFIAALGLFGLSAFATERRTKEIGIRKALGASKADILRLLLWEFVKPVLWANAIAWPVDYFVMHRWLAGFAYHVELSPWIFLTASALALVIAVLTVAGHAILVARAQPVAALRYE